MFLKILFIYLFIFTERGREGEKKGEKHQCLVASHTPLTGDLPHNPGMCPRLEIKPATLCFTGWHPTHWAIPARADCNFLNIIYLNPKTFELRRQVTCLLLPPPMYNGETRIEKSLYLFLFTKEKEMGTQERSAHSNSAIRLEICAGSFIWLFFMTLRPTFLAICFALWMIQWMFSSM